MADTEEQMGIQTITWERVKGAFQYRFIIRDDQLEKITNKDVTNETTYQFDWNERDLEHNIRYRVQYRTELEGEWLDMDNYQYLHPPGSSILRTLIGTSITSESGGELAVTESGHRKYSIEKWVELDKEYKMRKEGVKPDGR